MPSGYLATVLLSRPGTDIGGSPATPLGSVLNLTHPSGEHVVYSLEGITWSGPEKYGVLTSV